MNLQKFFDFKVVRAPKIGPLFEEIHLRKFFAHFTVDCVFDVGANVGQYASMLRRIGYKGPIISFEPMPKAAAILREKARGDPNCYVEEVALDSAAGTRAFNVMNSDQFSSLHAPSTAEVHLFTKQNIVAQAISVSTMTLTEAFVKYEKQLNFTRPFLKMDTQGHDLTIAKAAGRTLQQFVGLQSELSIRRLYEDTSNYTEVIAYYASLGFELSAFVPNNDGHFPRLIEIDCIMYNTSSSL